MKQKSSNFHSKHIHGQFIPIFFCANYLIVNMLILSERIVVSLLRHHFARLNKPNFLASAHKPSFYFFNCLPCTFSGLNQCLLGTKTEMQKRNKSRLLPPTSGDSFLDVIFRCYLDVSFNCDMLACSVQLVMVPLFYQKVFHQRC